MTDKQFRALLNWYMVSDPWEASEEDHSTITDLVISESKSRGYDSWVAAYHEMPQEDE